MNIFINTISSPAILILFNNDRQIIDKLIFEIKGNESSLLIPKVDEILKNNSLTYNHLDNIIVVNGPGSFTGVRTTVLAANSINYIIKKNMTAISYFNLHQKYPIIKASSKRDCFVQKNKNSEIEIIMNEILISEGINIERLEQIDYISIIKTIKFDNLNQIEALYIKKPNIF